jgi:predicted dehydrogenase
VRFGVVGTGYWAQAAHAAGISAAEGAQLVGIWGRDPQRTADAAASCSTDPYADFEALLQDVDALAFAVPPDVQARLALQAAQAGKHLLLDKPVALEVAAARELEAAVAAGVASVVFFTGCFARARREWVRDLSSEGYRDGGVALWLGSAFAEGSPFDTPWRHEKGALWDLGPHLVAAVTDALGPVTEVLSASGGVRDLVHLVFRHESGATSTATATLEAPPAAGLVSLRVWGRDGVSEMPDLDQSAAELLSVAVSELIACASTGETHPQDMSFGRHVVELLASAESLLEP